MKVKNIFCGLMILLLFGLQNLIGQDIIKVIKEGDLNEIKNILKKDPEALNFKNERGVSVLHIAAENSRLEIVKFLIKKGLDKNVFDINNMTPLQYAVKAGKKTLVEYFIGLGVDINHQTKIGQTALHFAGINNHKKILEILLKKGAKTELKDQWERTPLLATLLRNGDLETFKLFVKYRANLKAKSKRNTVIMRAAMGNFTEIVELLLDNNIKIDKKNTRLFYLSVNNGLLKLFKVFEKSGIDYKTYKEKEWLLLHYAANGGSPEIVKTILKNGFEVNKQNKYGWTPLHTASYYGHRQAVKMLLGNGADINKKTYGGKTAYNIADNNGYNDIKKLLRSKGANLEKHQLSVDKSLYLGQKKPGNKISLFAADIVSTHRGESNCLTFSPDGKEIFWGSYFRKKKRSKVLYSKIDKGQWSIPEFSFFSKGIKFADNTPFFSPKGDKLFFISRRPINSEDKGGKENIWVIKKNNLGWSKPEPVSDLINSKNPHMQFSVSRNGTMFFNSKDGGGKGKSDLYYSKFINEQYKKPVNLGTPVNSKYTEFNPFIAPDESYLIFTRIGDPDGFGGSDLYISFFKKNEKWSKPLNMGEKINSNAWETCPIVSPDKKYLFFNRSSDIYWISAKIIDDLRLKILK